MKVLVTGGGGFIGSHIVDLLMDKGYTPIVIDNLSTGYREYISEDVIFYNIDLTSSELKKVFYKEKPDYVIHLAAQVNVANSMKDPMYDAKNNILGSIQLLECCKEFEVKKIIYSSSCAVYGDAGNYSITEDFPTNPISYYGISKLTPEHYIKLFNKHFNLPYTILRYANVYGPRQTPKGEGGVVPIFMQKLFNEETPIIYGNGDQTRDFVYVKDVATANYLSLQKGTNETFNISCDNKTSINQLYTMISRLFQLQLPPKYCSKRDEDIQFSQLNNDKAKKSLGWHPLYEIFIGLQETFNHYISREGVE